jgi:hypothetical protein
VSDTPDTPETAGELPHHIGPDTPAPEPAEVVHPGAGAAGVAGRPAGRLVRIGLALLVLNGALTVFFGFVTATNPEAGICASAVAELEDAEEPALDPDEVDCDDDAEREAAIAAAEEANGDDDLPTEGTYRTSGIIGVVVGVVMIAGGFLTLRTGSRRLRTVALVGAGLGIIIPVLGYLSIGISAFVVYAIFFSADARATFGDPGGPRMFRPRV